MSGLERGEHIREQAPRVELDEELTGVLIGQINRLMEEASELSGEARRKKFLLVSKVSGFLGDPESAENQLAMAEQPITAAAPTEQPEPVEQPTQHMPTAEPSQGKSIFERAKEKTAGAFDFRRTRAAKVIGAVAATATLAIAGNAILGNGGGERAVGAEPAKAKTIDGSTGKEIEAETGWKRDELTPNEEHRWLASGFPDIGKAKTKKEARQAAGQWLKVIRGDEDTFKFVYDQIHGGDIEKTKLFENGHSTPYAEKRLKELQLTLAMSEIKKGYASRDIRNPYNTGLDSNGDVVVASNPGMSGNTEAIIIELPNGKRIAIMCRCAQPVVEGKPAGVPEGPTDQGGVGPNKQPKPTEGQPNPMHPPADGPPKEAEQHPADPGRTPGYPGRGHAEDIVGSQQGDPHSLEPTEHGTEVPDSQSGGKAPGGGDSSVVSAPPASAPPNPEYDSGGNVSSGTDEGTGDPEPTDGSGQTSGAGTDPGMPG